MTLNEVQYDFNAQGEIFVAKLASPRSPPESFEREDWFLEYKMCTTSNSNQSHG